MEQVMPENIRGEAAAAVDGKEKQQKVQEKINTE
jgi:hypothetical protein